MLAHRAQAPSVPFLIKISTFIPRVPSLSQTRQFTKGKKKKKLWIKTQKILKRPDSSLTSLPGFVRKLSFNPTQGSQTSSQLLG